MNNNQDNPNNRKKTARTLEEVPLFPYKHVRMESENQSFDNVESAQFDFVQQAGQPSQPPNPEKKND